LIERTTSDYENDAEKDYGIIAAKHCETDDRPIDEMIADVDSAHSTHELVIGPSGTESRPVNTMDSWGPTSYVDPRIAKIIINNHNYHEGPVFFHSKVETLNMTDIGIKHWKINVCTRPQVENANHTRK
jgi:hypothetical protein